MCSNVLFASTTSVYGEHLGDQGKEEQMMSTSTRYTRTIYLDTRLVHVCYVTVYVLKVAMCLRG